jgi:hypothetical protein
MSIGSKIGSKGMFATSAFYAIIGIIFLALLPLRGFAPHVGLLGIFSLIAAYGLLRKRAWSFWLVIILFVSGTTFAVFMIYDILAKEYLLGIGMVIYLILTWVFTAYIALRRRVLEA